MTTEPFYSPEPDGNLHESFRDPGSSPHVAPASQVQALWYSAPPVRQKELEGLRGTDAPLPRGGLLGLVEGLLKQPANVLFEIRTNASRVYQLTAILIAAMIIVGFVMGTFAAGMQLLVVPLKLAVGFLLATVICWPSLYLMNCLSGSERSMREVWGAQCMGAAITAVMMVGFSPILWVFAQSTQSSGFMGFLYLSFFTLSAVLGVRLTQRVLAYGRSTSFSQVWLWGMIYMVVALQMCTTMRPLFGEYEGFALAPKMFFLHHWANEVAGAP